MPLQNSPYFTGAAPNFGPPSGMAGLISQGRDVPNGWGQGLQQFADVADKFKQQQNAGKAAEYFFKANPDALSAAGIHPEELKTLSATDKAAAAAGVMKQQAYSELQQRLNDYAAQARERDAQAKAADDAGKVVAAFAQPLPAGTEDTPQNRLTNALRSAPPRDVGRTLPVAMDALNKFYSIAANGRKGYFDPSGPQVTDIPGLPGGKRVVTGPNTSEIKIANTDAPEAPPGYFAASDGKGGWKYLKLNPEQMTDEQKTKVTAQYEKNIDDLLKSYAFAKGDPEMEQMFKDRIEAHKQAIKDLNSGGAATPAARPTKPIVKPAAPTLAATPAAGAIDNFDTEDDARAAGKQDGDIVVLRGVGKVRLK